MNSSLSGPVIVRGKSINLRSANEGDAEFIVGLRTDATKSRYLNPTSSDVGQQVEYLRNTRDAQDQWYFIIESTAGVSLGTVRIYDVRGDSFCWGSWIIASGAPVTTAIESALLVYEFAYYGLGFKRTHFDVRKGNAQVLAFHQRLGAQIDGETDSDYLFTSDVGKYEVVKRRYLRFLPPTRGF